jgi:hypothetical protein
MELLKPFVPVTLKNTMIGPGPTKAAGGKKKKKKI